MNDHELDQLLRRAKAPEREEGYWAFFPKRVTNRLPQVAATVAPTRKSRGFAWLGVGLATACLVAGFVIGARYGSTNKTVVVAAAPNDPLAASRKLFREINEEFPNQVRAIVIDGVEMQLLLAEAAEQPSSKPLWLKICRGGDCRSLITFSGQKVQMGTHTYEVLADAHDQIILVGDDLVWSSGEKTPAPEGVRIQAAML